MNISAHPIQQSNRENFFSYSYLFGMFLLVASLPYSKFLVSLSEIILLLSWLFQGHLGEKIKLFAKNKTALVISSLFILHLAGLLYTTDFNYGLEDVKKKIPLLLFPLLFASSAPLPTQLFKNILYVFTISVIVATGICFYVLLGYTHVQILQPQQASVFISHIRFGLLISLSVFILGYFVTKTKSIALKILIPLLIAWLILFLLMMESATGLVCTVTVSAILFFRLILHIRNIRLKIILLVLFILCGALAARLFHSTVTQFEGNPLIGATQLLPVTKQGNPYVHDTLNKETENGHYVWLNVCEKELAEEWNKKSPISYQGKDLRGNAIKYTLIRFLTSKGVNKDAEGVRALSTTEVHAVEKGIPDINFVSLLNPTARLQKIVWEFELLRKGGNPSGHSVAQRFEFWKAAVGIIQDNFLLGVGTGDVKNAFENQYNHMHSPLTKEWRLRSHNQFLAIGTAFGIVGILIFLITLLYPLLRNQRFHEYFYLAFFCIAFLSLFVEDTLETQTGVTFFAFFNSYFLFTRQEK